jgi:hypothetical protein
VWTSVRRKPRELRRALDTDAFFRNVWDQVRREPGGMGTAYGAPRGWPPQRSAPQLGRASCGNRAGAALTRGSLPWAGPASRV